MTSVGRSDGRVGMDDKHSRSLDGGHLVRAMHASEVVTAPPVRPAS